MSNSYADLLNTPIGDVERPPPTPVGTYLVQVDGYEMVVSNQKKTPGVQFNYQVLAPQDDVDADEIEKLGDRVSKIRLRETFWITEGSLFRLKEYLEKVLQIQSDPGSPLSVILPESKGRQLLVAVKQVPNKDGTEMIAQVERSMAYEA